MRIMVFVCAAWIASAGFAPAIAQDALMIDDVPLQADTRITSSSGISENFERFSGAWIGAWGGLLHHILVVENIRPDGNANIIYAVGDNAAANVHRQWRRDIAVISGNTLRVGTFATYEFTVGDRLKATYSGGNGRASATMLKVELAELTRPGAEIHGSETPNFSIRRSTRPAGRFASKSCLQSRRDRGHSRSPCLITARPD